MLCGLENC